MDKEKDLSFICQEEGHKWKLVEDNVREEQGRCIGPDCYETYNKGSRYYVCSRPGCDATNTVHIDEENDRIRNEFGI